jgi:hypothetical protein
LVPSSSLQPTFRPCNTDACGAFVLVVGDWTACSHTCGGGTSTRQVSCVRSADLTEVSLALCNATGADGPPTTRACNVQSCDMFRFVASPWLNCTATCGGTRSRSLKCVKNALDTGSDGGAADADVAMSLCERVAGLVRPATVESCDASAACFCYNNACSGHGVCLAGRNRCVCDAGYSGRLCERSSCEPSTPANASVLVAAVDGVVDVDGVCCTGVMQRGGRCCSGATAVLDSSGACCASGVVDVCGVCDGNATVVDAAGVCCSGMLDGSGLCCPADVAVDSCGVCGGVSNCATLYTVDFTAQVDVLHPLRWPLFRAASLASLAAAVARPVADLSLLAIDRVDITTQVVVDLPQRVVSIEALPYVSTPAADAILVQTVSTVTEALTS